MPLVRNSLRDMGFNALNRRDILSENRDELFGESPRTDMPLTSINQILPPGGIPLDKLTIDKLYVNQNIQSSNFLTGSVGWRILGNGDAEFNDGTFRGDLIAGSIHIPDEDTTANSMHTDSQGNTWWGATETSFTANNDNATAYVLKTGVAKFDSVRIAGSGNFIGTGSDGAVDGSANVTITGSNNTIIIKNYTSIAAAQGGGKTFTVTPTGCIVIIKVRGVADLTAWTFNFTGKGMPGGTGGTAVSAPPNTANGVAGSSGSSSVLGLSVTGGVGGSSTASGVNGRAGGGGASVTTAGTVGGGSSSGAGGTTSNPFLSAYLQFLQVMIASPGGGGGGGASGGIDATGTPCISGVGGNGGAGGGCVIIQVGGAITFSSTIINCDGSDGVNGGNETGTSGNSDGGGGGGGGGGGSLICLYNGTKTGSPTVDVTGGAGGTGGTGQGAQDGGTGGAGAAGFQLIEQNVAFA